MAPLLLCLDIQRVFVARGALHAPGAGDVLLRARRLLNVARARGWSIAHCLLRRENEPIRISAEAARPVDGFEPLAREMVFEREALSAYAHADLPRIVEDAGQRAIVTGLGASLSFLATAFDAFERGHRLMLAPDALGAQEGVEASAEAHLAVARDLTRLFGFVATAPASPFALQSLGSDEAFHIAHEGAEP